MKDEGRNLTFELELEIRMDNGRWTKSELRKEGMKERRTKDDGRHLKLEGRKERMDDGRWTKILINLVFNKTRNDKTENQ